MLVLPSSVPIQRKITCVPLPSPSVGDAARGVLDLGDHLDGELLLIRPLNSGFEKTSKGLYRCDMKLTE